MRWVNVFLPDNLYHVFHCVSVCEWVSAGFPSDGGYYSAALAATRNGKIPTYFKNRLTRRCISLTYCEVCVSSMHMRKHCSTVKQWEKKYRLHKYQWVESRSCLLWRAFFHTPILIFRSSRIHRKMEIIAMVCSWRYTVSTLLIHIGCVWLIKASQIHSVRTLNSENRFRLAIPPKISIGKAPTQPKQPIRHHHLSVVRYRAHCVRNAILSISIVNIH